MAVNMHSSQTRRRLMIGSNVVLACLIVWAIVVLINVLTGRAGVMPRDLTRSGQFSLSPRTIKLLTGLEPKVTLTGLYRVEGDEGPARQQSEVQKRQVEDMLRRYADLSGKITYQMLDPFKDNAAKTALLQRLIGQYRGETEKHQQIVEAFRTLDKDLADLVGTEHKRFDDLTRSQAKVFEEDRNLQMILGFFARFDPKGPMTEVNNLISGGDIPYYSEAVDLIQKFYENARSNLRKIGEYLAGEALQTPGLTDDAKKFFTDAPQRYQAVLDAVDQQMSQMTNLPKLELEQIYNQVKQKNAKVILVEAEGSSKVKVLDFQDVWTVSQDAAPGSDPRRPKYAFNGEAAVSSAILSLTAKEKSAVVFIHAGQPSPIKPGYAAMRMAPAPYGAWTEKLEQANFLVEAWDISGGGEPPALPEAKRRVYVVVPAQPQRPQQMGMPPAGGYQKAQIDKIEQMIDQGDRFLFLVNFAPGMFTPPYPFKDLLEKKFGLKVDTDKLVLRGIEYRDQVFPQTRINIARYENFEITQPIQSLNTGFELAVPITLASTLPDNVTVKPLVTIRGDQDQYWAESNIIMLMQQKTAQRDEGDVSPPFHLGVAVEDAARQSKAIVFGDDIFAQDALINDADLMLTAQGFVGKLTNPGNSELLTNSAFWLNDNENMISVGPRGMDVPRIADISDRGQLAWKIFLWVGWPFGALLVGGVMYLVRQK